jgi:hypothetical protein
LKESPIPLKKYEDDFLEKPTTSELNFKRNKISPVDKKFNYTSTSNFKRIEDFQVTIDEEIKVNFQHENNLKMKILNNFLSKFE